MSESEFWSKVDRNGPIPKHRPELGPCWIWVMARSERGYGVTSLNWKPIPAHRLAHLYHYGSLEGVECVCHKCDTPPCCNPSHLFAGTSKDNSKDMVQKGRQSKGKSHSEFILPGRQRGDDHYASILTSEAVTEMRRQFSETKATLDEIAKAFGVSRGAAEKAIRGKTWKHVADQARKFKNGERRSKYSPERIAEVRRLRSEGMKMKQIAAHFGMPIWSVNDIVYHRTHKEGQVYS